MLNRLKRQKPLESVLRASNGKRMFGLKLSASVINLWQRGDRQGVYDALHGKWREPTPQMEFGINQHKEWELEVNRTGHLPEVFGGEKIANPITEHYYTIDLCEWLRLSGILDLQYGEHGEVICDYKTGKTTANQYTNSLQVGCYALLRPEAKMFIYRCYNQYDGKTTEAVVHLNDDKREEWADMIMSIALDIRSWLEPIEPDFDNYGINNHERKENGQDTRTESV